MNMIIRDLKKEDYDFVLRVNEENVEVLSPMDRQRLEFYAGIADMFKIVEVNGKQAAFLIAIRDGADYPNVIQTIISAFIRPSILTSSMWIES